MTSTLDYFVACVVANIVMFVLLEQVVCRHLVAANQKPLGSKEDLENIFEKFYRVKDDESHKIKGSGLGLYLVKYFIELHQGDIEVESTLGVGTKFIIKLKNE